MPICPLSNWIYSWTDSIDADTPKEILDSARYLENTVKLDKINPEDFDAIFLPGGHGTRFDRPENQKLQLLLREFITGQNPQSSESVAKAIIDILG